MTRGTIVDSNTVTTAAARTRRDLEAAAALLELRGNNGTGGQEIPVEPSTSSLARLARAEKNRVKPEAEEASRQAEKSGTSPSPLTKTNESGRTPSRASTVDINAAATNTRTDSDAAATPLALREGGGPRRTKPIAGRSTRGPERLRREGREGVEPETAGSSRQAERSRAYLSPTSKANERGRAAQSGATPSKGTGTNIPTSKENIEVGTEQAQRPQDSEPQEKGEGLGPRRSVRLRDKAKVKAEKDGNPSTKNGQCMFIVSGSGEGI